MAQWTGCIAGALTKDEFERELAAAGFDEIELRETHRVHEHAGSAIIRARLPGRMIAECALDLAGLRTQRDRYRALGEHVEGVERAAGRLVVDFSTGVDHAEVQEALEVERSCCPFFTLDYDAGRRRLAVTVEEPDQDAALDAIAFALGAGG
jgi:hypothetical protein